MSCEVTQWLTGDIIVLPFQELQTPEVGAELLEFKRKLNILVGLVTVQQGGVPRVDGAALHLTPGDQVHSVELLLFPLGGVPPWTNNVHLIPYLRVEDQTSTWNESVWGYMISNYFTGCCKPVNHRWQSWTKQLNYTRFIALDALKSLGIN